MTNKMSEVKDNDSSSRSTIIRENVNSSRDDIGQRKFVTLSPSGEREVVNDERAKEIVTEWKTFLEGDDGTMKVVNKVTLSNKSYTAGAAEIVGDFISKNCASSIKVAILADVIAGRMEQEGLQVLQILSDSLKHAELVELDLSDNAMGSKGIRACHSVLGGQRSSLERLTLCNNGLSEYSMAEVADILLQGSEDMDEDCICERLTKIHFYNNMSGNKGCEAFARILSKTNHRLIDVRYSGTRAGREGSTILASALDNPNMKNLQRLDLADNSFGAQGAQLLSRALFGCRHLQYLNLRDCVLDNDAIQSISHALFGSDGSSESLQHLDVSGNEITARGARALSELLEEMVNLRVFHAEENEMTSRGIQYLAPLLPPSLQELKLGFNECGTLGAQALIQHISITQQYTNLHTLHLDGNSFLPEIVQKLQDAFGDKLVEMEDNDDENDFDDDLSDTEEDDVSQTDDLVKALAGVKINESQLC